MTTYINDTIARADIFDTQDDKLKYIKNQLSWKKLFSVIVSDMNSIRLCLYKREHIKDRSRYLKYEEAVGSTGQSQGIYIQFLISVIHYISSINSSYDMGISGNTIFIDNPFGAAKDISGNRFLNCSKPIMCSLSFRQEERHLQLRGCLM